MPQSTFAVKVCLVRKNLFFHLLLNFVIGVDGKSGPCQIFFKEGLTKSFTKIMLDIAVVNWKERIQVGLFVSE